MRRGSALAFAAVFCVCIGCDHATKQIAQHALAGSPGFSVAADTVRFELARNPGAFLSLGATLPEPVRRAVLIVAVPLLLLALCALRLREGEASLREVLALALLCGGGLANWLDRLFNEGAVTDFVSLGVGPLRTGIFNVADVVVVAGVALLLLSVRARPRDPAGTPSAAE